MSELQELATVVASVLGATLRISVPLVLCALAGVLSERAGVIDIGLEGKLLAAAFAAAMAGAFGWPAGAALLAAVAAGMALSAVHGLACIRFRGDQIVSGVAINILALGLTAVIGLHLFQRGGRTPDVPPEGRFGVLFDEAARAVQDWPLIGPLLAEALLRHTLLTWLAFALVPAVWWLLYRTRFGLRLRAVGENPAMVDAAGISVAGLRWRAVLLAGVLCGIGGAFLTLAQNASFTPGMSAGRGFMALAAMVFGHWHPVRALWACLLFGLLDAVAIRLQGTVLPGLGAVPVELIQALPYLFTVVLLAGFFGRAQAPAPLGQSFTKER